MENIFLIDELKAIDSFIKQNPTKEDFFDIVGEPDPEFYIRDYQRRRNAYTDVSTPIIQSDTNYNAPDGFEEEVARLTAKQAKLQERYDIKVPDGYYEVELYDNCKSFEENFEIGNDKKYVLFEVTKNRKMYVGSPEFILPSPDSKCVVDMDKIEEFSSSLEFMPIDYDTFWGLRFKSFMKYKSNFFLCDERVIFEALLIKYKYFDYKPFYWSKEKIFEEVGIKKDRATKILDRFIDLGIVSKELKKTFIENRPMQINYYSLNPDTIIDLVPQIYEERDNIDVKSKMTAYLQPALSKHISNMMQ